MQNTKEKILETALQLFNEQGVDNITVRHIAKEMGISHGNLCYHYPNISVIVENLYKNLLHELDLELIKLPLTEVNLQAMFEIVKFIFNKFYKYRFLMQDFIGVIRKVPQLKKQHRELVAARFMFFKIGVEAMQKNELIREQRIEGEFENFFHHLFIISDFWMAEAEILFEGNEAEKLQYYTKLTFDLIVPFLTEKGLNEYQTINFD